MPFKMLEDVIELDISVGCDKAHEMGTDTLPVDRPFNCAFLRHDVPEWVGELIRQRVASHRVIRVPQIDVHIRDYGGAANSLTGDIGQWRTVPAFRRELLIEVLGTFLEDPTAVLSCSFPSMRFWYVTDEDGNTDRAKVHGMQNLMGKKDGE